MEHSDYDGPTISLNTGVVRCAGSFLTLIRRGATDDVPGTDLCCSRKGEVVEFHQCNSKNMQKVFIGGIIASKV